MLEAVDFSMGKRILPHARSNPLNVGPADHGAINELIPPPWRWPFRSTVRLLPGG